MDRSKWFLIVNMVVVGMIALLSFYFRAAPNSQHIDSGNLLSQKNFLKDAFILDSLFNNYKIVAVGNEEAALVEPELRLKDHLNKMMNNCDKQPLVNEIACKLIHNYSLRIQLIGLSAHMKNQSSNQIHLLKKQITELEKSNEQIRLQNQMVQQAILNLP